MQLEAFLKDTYGLVGSLAKLDGEYDQNYVFEGHFGRHIFKVMRKGCDLAFVTTQITVLQHLATQDIAANTPIVIKALSGDYIVRIPGENGERVGWMTDFLSGDLMASSRPWTPKLGHSLGEALGQLDVSLAGLSHLEFPNDLKWDLLKAAWIKEKIPLIEAKNSTSRVTMLVTLIKQFESLLPQLVKCPRTVIHGDANEMNVFVSGTPADQVTGLIDFGDMSVSARIAEAAIAAAYIMMDADDPLANAAAVLAGYHKSNPLQATEIELFFPAVLMRLAVSVTVSTERKIAEPDNPYLVQNEAPAWRLLERFHSTDTQLITAYFRAACELDASDTCAEVSAWLHEAKGGFSPLLAVTPLSHAHKLDLSFASAVAVNTPEAPNARGLNYCIAKDLAAAGTDVAVGGWGEARPIYTGAAYGHTGPDPLGPIRTHHLGVDITIAAGSELFAPLGGTVWAVGYAPGPLDYGGYLILEHLLPTGTKFFSLYGHIAPESLTHLPAGTAVEAGDPIGKIGNYNENGGWWPHVHLQLMTEEPMGDGTPPGACEIQFWPAASALFPNPAAFLNLDRTATEWHPPPLQQTLKKRLDLSVKNQKLSYDQPLHVTRGWKHFLTDQEGRNYIDAYNNVPHVGHANTAVIKAVTDQMQLVSTNTRYLHESLINYAEALTSKLPKQLSKCLFTSSASEANELAIRLARKATGAKNMLVMEHGYHGVTTGAMAISPYKFSQKTGERQEDWVHVTPQPDSYRGRYQGSENPARDCVIDTQAIIDQLHEGDQKIAGYISECLPSVGGQIVLPNGFLKAVYSAVRAAGGLCIADDVQTSLGRLGDFFWGFEYQDVVPDILVLGKPLGNGYPLAAVVTTPEVAESFAEGPEFFSTFGGSTVSCTAGLAVLNAITDGNLQENAQCVGAHLKTGFSKLQTTYPVIGDIRGMGLFWGLDLVLDRGTRAPATQIADYVKNRLYDKRVLIGTDGPFDNVLKVRPPLTFDKPSADVLLHQLNIIFAEKGAQP